MIQFTNVYFYILCLSICLSSCTNDYMLFAIILLSTQQAPSFVPALTSGRWNIKWTQLANIPAPMYGAHVAVQDKKIYVAGGTNPVDDAIHQVYVYNLDFDHWTQLPSSGCYNRVPHIIGGKLAIIGGLLSVAKIVTNKVSTFDETNQTWTSILTFSQLGTDQGWFAIRSMLLLLEGSNILTVNLLY